MHQPESETFPPLLASEQELATTLYLEGPAIDLVDLPLDEMTREQIEEVLASIKPLTQQPGALTRNMAEEATSVAVGKPRPARSKKKVSIDDLG